MNPGFKAVVLYTPEAVISVTPDKAPDTSAVPLKGCPQIVLDVASFVAEATLLVVNAISFGVTVTCLVIPDVGLDALVIDVTRLHIP